MRRLRPVLLLLILLIPVVAVPLRGGLLLLGILRHVVPLVLLLVLIALLVVVVTALLVVALRLLLWSRLQPPSPRIFAGATAALLAARRGRQPDPIAREVNPLVPLGVPPVKVHQRIPVVHLEHLGRVPLPVVEHLDPRPNAHVERAARGRLLLIFPLVVAASTLGAAGARLLLRILGELLLVTTACLVAITTAAAAVRYRTPSTRRLRGCRGGECGCLRRLLWAGRAQADDARVERKPLVVSLLPPLVVHQRHALVHVQNLGRPPRAHRLDLHPLPLDH